MRINDSILPKPPSQSDKHREISAINQGKDIDYVSRQISKSSSLLSDFDKSISAKTMSTITMAYNYPSKKKAKS